MAYRSIIRLFAVLALISSVAATSVIRFSFDSLCETSVRIAHVTCIESEPVLAEDGIRTRSLFRVIEGIKGGVHDEARSVHDEDSRFPKEIEIMLPGGQIGDQRVTVPGMPVFGVGDEMVLFLSGPDAIGSAWPVGLGQGCYRVIANPSTGRSVHLQRGVTPIPTDALFKPSSSAPYQVDLKSFLDKVRDTIRSTAQSED